MSPKLLLSKEFDQFTPEEFYKHAKGLVKPYKPKVLKTRKLKTDENNTGPKPSIKRIRKTKKNVGAIEAT